MTASAEVSATISSTEAPDDDDIRGGQGADLIIGGTGNDRLRGGKGPDAFLFRSGDGEDEILDFGAEDRLLLDLEDISSFTAVLSGATESRRGLLLDFGDEGSLWLRGAELSSLNAEQFSFV